MLLAAIVVCFQWQLFSRKSTFSVRCNCAAQLLGILVWNRLIILGIPSKMQCFVEGWWGLLLPFCREPSGSHEILLPARDRWGIALWHQPRMPAEIAQVTWPWRDLLSCWGVGKKMILNFFVLYWQVLLLIAMTWWGFFFSNHELWGF